MKGERNRQRAHGQETDAVSKRKFLQGGEGEGPGNIRARMIDNAAESEAGIGDRTC